MQKKQLTCETCGRTFLQKNNLNQHKRSLHDGHTVYPCTSCGKHFNRYQNMVRHQNICPKAQSGGGVKRAAEEGTSDPKPSKKPRTETSFNPEEVESALQRALVTYRLKLSNVHENVVFKLLRDACLEFGASSKRESEAETIERH